VKQQHFIDSHKGVTALAVLIMMGAYQQWQNPTAWAYLGMHGTYGLLWLLKSRLFGDRQWNQPCRLSYGMVIWGGLTLYWIAPWLLTSRGVQVPSWCLGLCIALYGLGVFFHFASDMQKHTALKLEPGLITDGFWSLSRNPNYFGELLIYLGFGLLAMHWLPILVILSFIAVVWYPNMRRKDRSLARFESYADYRERTKLFIPFLL
jgi:protein-S-isoprenylcysteine O-methyltransferase Ste14